MRKDCYQRCNNTVGEPRNGAIGTDSKGTDAHLINMLDRSRLFMKDTLKSEIFETHTPNFFHHEIYCKNKNFSLSEFDATHEQLSKRYKELECESVSLQKSRESIQKSLVGYHNRSMDIADRRKDLHTAVDNVRNSLRTIMNS